MKSHPLQASFSFLGLPDKQILGAGQARAFSGEAMETAICHLFNLTPGRINSLQAVNPDAFTPDDKPAEIKSLKRGQKLIIYDWRAEKDPGDQLYFVGIHNRPPSLQIASIWRGLAETMREVLIIPSPVVARLAAACPLHHIKIDKTASGERNGYQRAGYRDGYRSIPFARLKAICDPLPFKCAATVHGLRFEAQPFMARPDALATVEAMPTTS